MEQFWEESVSKRNPLLQNALFALANVMMVGFGAVAMITLYSLTAVIGNEGFGPSFFLTVAEILLFGGCAALLFFQRDKLKTEFDYTFTAGQMDFAMIFNNKSRKGLGTLNLRNVDACGLVSSGSFQRYVSMRDIKHSHWFVNRDAELLFFFFQKEGKKRMIVIEPSEKMVGLIKKSLSPGVWQNN